MRPATAGAQAAQSENIPLQPQSAGQIVCAALMGNGVERLEEAVRLNIPFVLQPPEQGRPADLMPQPHQVNEKLMAEMTEKILSRAYERGGQSLDKITVQFKALAVVAHLEEQIRQHGLHVYTQKLLFDPSRPLEQRLALLKAMKVEDFETRRASVAIATGRLPELPAYTVADLVRSLDSTWRPVSVGLGQSISAWIEDAKPWLVEFPMPNLEAGAGARTDHFTSTDHVESAHFGLGFFLLSHDEKRDRFYIVTPALTAGRMKERDDSMRYSKQYQLESRSSFMTGHRELADLVRCHGGKQLARLEVCAKCGTIFSVDRADLNHAC
jgi:hypothetical protein